MDTESTIDPIPPPWRAVSVFRDNAPNQWQIHTRGTSARFNGECVAIVSNELDARLMAAAHEMRDALVKVLGTMERDDSNELQRVMRLALIKANWGQTEADWGHTG